MTTTAKPSNYKFLVIFVILICLLEGVWSAPNPVFNSIPKSIKGKIKKAPRINKERYDGSINDYLTQRTCWFSEMCKEEFSQTFRCRCPMWSYCSSPGKYYNAYCTMSSTGYLWTQPKGFFLTETGYNTKNKHKQGLSRHPFAGKNIPPNEKSNDV